MNERINLLDHGYVEPVETWGSDERIIEAARMSTGKGFRGWGTDDVPGDERLLAYLWDHHHETPFEMAGAIFEIQAPIFVFREWHRHRTQSFNEMSARYVPLPDVNYIPTVERLMMAGGANKQSGAIEGADVLSEHAARGFQVDAQWQYKNAEAAYRWAVQSGVPKELARILLPVGRYSRMRASANLRNWLAFLTLRQAPNAQYEIRVYADAIHGALAKAFPRTMALFGANTPPAAP